MIGLLIIKSLYFFLPAYFANMMPVLCKKLPFLARPVSEKWFGRHKIWRGLVVAVIAGTVVFWLQGVMYDAGFRSWASIDYSDFSLWLGFWLGLGAILGDLVKSYYKRKAGIKEGRSWIPFDQLDFVIGGLVLGWIVYVPDVEIVFFILLLSPLLHVVVNYIGYVLRMKENRW